MSVQLNFDASTVEPSIPFETLPADDYVVALSKADAIPTKAKDGHYLKCEFTILEGEYKGRKLFDNLNLWNMSTQASEIAWRQLSALCHAANVLQVETTDQLIGIPVLAKIGIEDDEKYGSSNTIRGFSAATGNFEQPTQTAMATMSAAAPVAAAAPAAAAAPVSDSPVPPPWATAPAPAAAAPAAAAPVVAAPVVAAPAAAAPENDMPPWARTS